MTDPETEADAYFSALEESYERLVYDKECGDCAHCEDPERNGFDNPSRIGWCMANMDFTDMGESVRLIHCPDFEEGY